MSTTTQHWSGPNGCDDKCPACAMDRADRHTPGPWVADWPDIRAHGGIVAEVNTIQDRGMADAWLIAASPDLLTALYATLACMEESHWDEIESQHSGDGPSCSYCRIMDRAREAIVLATGKATWPTEAELQRESDALEAARGGAK